MDPEVRHWRDRRTVILHYTNYKGVTKFYRIIPMSVWFGKTRWHPEAQWMLMAHDLERKKRRDFAMRDIVSWTPYDPDELL